MSEVAIVGPGVINPAWLDAPARVLGLEPDRFRCVNVGPRPVINPDWQSAPYERSFFFQVHVGRQRRNESRKKWLRRKRLALRRARRAAQASIEREH